MAPKDPVTIAKYSDPHEASMAKSLLESRGIIGTAMGGELNNMLWHLGPTISGVELQVAAEDAERATEILEAFLESQNQSRPQIDWICPHCGEDVEAEFEVCWSCGTPFVSPEETAITSVTSNSKHMEPESVSDVFEQESPAEVPDREDDFEEKERIVQTDERTYRAFRKAVLSLVFVPALPFALYELLQLGSEDLSPWAMKKYYQSVAIILLLSALYLGVISSLLRETG